MREQLFIRKNTERWKQFDRLIEEKTVQDPDILADLFIQTTDDLAYSRTFYPKSKTTRYLNSLAVRIHQKIYTVKKERTNRFITFWRDELPQLYYAERISLLMAFAMFTVGVIIGVISSFEDISFARLILGDSYVNKTLANIKRGDPMAVYKSMSSTAMFIGIALNNIRVSFFAFIGGAAFSLLTMMILLFNGIMLGVFQTLFYQQGLLLDSALVIWIHGTIEISVIIIAGGAGITMGNSLLFPGTYSRLHSFKRGAKNGLKMCFGLIPLFTFAAFLEGFVTRYTEMPMLLSVAIIGCSLLFILWYFIYYPHTYGKGSQHGN